MIAATTKAAEYLFKHMQAYETDEEAAAVLDIILEALQPAVELGEQISGLANIQARLAQEATKKISITIVNSRIYESQIETNIHSTMRQFSRAVLVIVNVLQSFGHVCYRFRRGTTLCLV